MMTYKTAAVVRAADIPKPTFTRWLDRRIIPVAGTGKGRSRHFDIGRIYQIAIAHALTRLGLPPTTAMKHAAKFNEPQRGREHGRLFGEGSTVMIVNSEGTASILQRFPDQDLGTLLRGLATIAVNLNQIVATVNRRIGIQA